MTRVSAAVLDHVRAPRNAGVLDAPGVVTGRAQAEGGTDRVVVYLQLDAERVQAARFRASGCPALIAAASLLTERISGRPRAEAAAIRAETLSEALALPSHQLGKAALVIEAFVEACTKWDDAAHERSQDPG